MLHVRTGDLAFFIADYPDATEAVSRPRCIHQGFMLKEANEVRILHAVQPAAEETLLLRFIQKRIQSDRFLGMKFLRLKPDARALVQAELATYPVQALAPGAIDDQFGRLGVSGNGLVLVSASQPADYEVEIDGIVYGAIEVASGQTLYSLFKRNWEYVYELDVNAPFRAANPDPHGVPENPAPGEILFPVREQ